MSLSWSARAGLSPPTRGNRDGRQSRRRQHGSIPAHAGEPRLLPNARRHRRVYPRPRGGTWVLNPVSDGRAGLSPPTRGNPPKIAPTVNQQRSIPAHAGEPSSDSARMAMSRVYPRPRGGTGAPPSSATADSGLSPPTRGNRRRMGRNSAGAGSIPAHAGEPPPPP